MPSGHLSVDYRRKALPRSITQPLLRRQQQRLYEAYARHFPPRPGEKVLDLGANGSLSDPRQHFFELNYPFRAQVTAAGLEDSDIFGRCYPEIPWVQVSRGEPLPFPDGAFDVVFSNAVIEHVGSRDQQRRFLAEVVRVGRAAFVTTPNRWFPIELHTVLPLVHWLPTPWYRAILAKLGFRFFSQEANLNLLDAGELARLVPAGVHANLHRRRLLGFTANLLLVLRAEDGGSGSPV